MKNSVIIGAICLLVLGAGIFLYFKNPFTHPPTPAGVNANTETPRQKEVSFKILDKGANAASMVERKNYAIYDVAEFSNFWKKAHGTDGKKMPTVDFSENYVIAVFAGTQPSGGYAISVSSITEVESTRSVAVLIEAPGADCTVIEEQTNPYEFISVPVSSADALSHTDTVTRTTCAAR